MIDNEDLAKELQVMPSDLLLKGVDLFKDSAVVTGKLGSMIDKTILTGYYWFRSQKVFKTITIAGCNGIDVVLVKTE